MALSGLLQLVQVVIIIVSNLNDEGCGCYTTPAQLKSQWSMATILRA
jgi:hypothetical protein